MTSSRVLFLVAVVASSACDDDAPGGVDAGIDAAEADASCANGACATVEQQREAALVRDFAERLKGATATAATIDWEAVANDAALGVLTGDGSEHAVFRALRAVQNAVPQGHQQLRAANCGSAGSVPWAQSTWYGVCGRPHGEAVIVTHARADNPLGLHAGDRILAAGPWTAGPGFLRAIAQEPMCGSSMPSPSAVAESAAASLFGLVDAGMMLTVQAPDGAMRTVSAPAHEAKSEWCISPFGGFDDYEAKATVRTDGVAVITVPGFLSSEHPLPSPLTQAAYDQWIADYVERLRVVLDGVKSAPAIVWDARSNSGGSSEVALAIVAGMPGAKAGVLSQGFQRVPDTFPFEYATKPVASYSYSMTTGGPLAYSGKVAVLTDGLTYSAGSYFAYAVKHFSTALIVGRPAAGAYGYGGNAALTVPGPPQYIYTVDGMQARDATGTPLEGNEPMPDLFVEYDPGDLAAGKDTVLEAAVAALLK